MPRPVDVVIRQFARAAAGSGSGSQHRNSNPWEAPHGARFRARQPEQLIGQGVLCQAVRFGPSTEDTSPTPVTGRKRGRCA